MPSASAINRNSGSGEGRVTTGAVRWRGRSHQSSAQPRTNTIAAVGKATGASFDQLSCGMLERITARVTPSGDTSGASEKPRSIAMIMRRSRTAWIARSPPAALRLLLRWIMAPNRLSTPILTIMPNRALPRDRVG